MVGLIVIDPKELAPENVPLVNVTEPSVLNLVAILEAVKDPPLRVSRVDPAGPLRVRSEFALVPSNVPPVWMSRLPVVRL